MDKNSEKPAFPPGTGNPNKEGLTKLEYFSIEILKAIVTKHATYRKLDVNEAALANSLKNQADLIKEQCTGAITYATILLAELEKQQ